MTVVLILALVFLAIFITSLFFANRKSDWEQKLEDEAQMKFLSSFRMKK
ncbi:MAG: hypothetical protein LUE29_12995 [Lachnospiraceae bacterium]|nr:hypothetical protein [Lachnospiraceae bacterium]